MIMKKKRENQNFFYIALKTRIDRNILIVKQAIMEH